MLCRNNRCRHEFADTFQFCPYCGKAAAAPKRKRRRANGEGSIRKRGSTYTARVVVGWRPTDDGFAPVRIERGGYKTISEAANAIPLIREAAKSKTSTVHGVDYTRILMRDLYARMIERDERRITRSTINCYKAAYKHYADIWGMPFADLNTEDWQLCVDDCPHGSRTRENMKALGTKLYKYANELRVFGTSTGTDFARFVWIDRADKESRQPFTLDEVARIRAAARSGNQGAQLILIMCATGFRPSEFLSLTHDSYDPKTNQLRGGAKTEAGKNRIVPVHPSVKPYVAARYLSGAPYLFGNGSEPFTLQHFRDTVFYPTLEALGIQPVPKPGTKPARTPYSTRHTFATLMKSVPGADRDKAALMGHTSYEMTLHYTHEDAGSLEAIVSAINI
jgi:integrase